MRNEECGVGIGKRMRQGLGLWCLVVVVFCLPPAMDQAVAQTVDEAAGAVEKHYENLTDLAATVSQRNTLKSLNKTQSFEGALRIKKPGKLRLDYTNGQIILINGAQALFYSKKSEQLIRKKFTDFAQMNIPVAFLLGAGRIRDDFEVMQPDPKRPRVLELMPKKSGAAMTKLRLVSEADGRIAELTIFDQSGNISTISFSDVRESAGLDDKLFVFTPPKGTEVIEQ
jgi:outer membrane lipoprotein carrier protein